MGFSLRLLPELVCLAFANWCQWRLGDWALAAPSFRTSARFRRAIRVTRLFATAWLGMSFVYLIPVLDYRLSSIGWLEWVKGFSIAWGISVVGIWCIAALYKRAPVFDPRRRQLLQTASAALFAAPLGVAGYGVVVGRSHIGIREVNVHLPGLPPDLEGLRLVQLSDIHLSPFLERMEVERAVAMANETKPHLALVTGDLITARDELLTDCLECLGKLRAEAGVLGCLGNHEVVADCEQRAKREGARLGIDFLRGEARLLRFGQAAINVAGVDYQAKFQPYLAGAEKLVRPEWINILLSHNPDVFPVAARQGYDLTLAGHTHGGQITLAPFEQYLNLARLFTPYVYGLYREGRASIYVTRGIGTVGVPARIGAPPEIALIRLCAT
ncbi:MAG: metallophosphoesterase [Bryobacteraceae bacterium]|nr:metallophosphoesterase [Bryobacteraceae bacterium]